MSWKFWSRKSSVPESEIRAVPASTLYRWYCYDVGVKDPHALDTKMGLIPISEDGQAMEQAESDRRLVAIAGLIPFMELIAGINAEAITATTTMDLFKSAGVDADSPELESLLAAMHTLHSFVSYAGLVAAFSAAAQLGLIDIPASVVSAVHDHE